MGKEINRPTPEQLAQLFHQFYEEEAPKHNYKTRATSRTTWDNVPDNNKNTMIATANRVIKKMFDEGWPNDEIERVADEVDE